ncbi:hypothetical protein B0T26DRAFT_752121 [Lasiosphaeria miniovina]|uniref:Uncharacterized protein n=1 Tax=Lasiosphaeria miniovina TaxID=1954250 RepID=A0AA40DYC7_9PEZI|nr:uncharacterized protein B0T26DRAFT_752121 [Lasiosphaeria miniovina]KAK0718162.1 hypothetical protein B0T26DRAFT_752121 [Lasiosphaeria miniovina]
MKPSDLVAAALFGLASSYPALQISKSNVTVSWADAASADGCRSCEPFDNCHSSLSGNCPKGHLVAKDNNCRATFAYEDNVKFVEC